MILKAQSKPDHLKSRGFCPELPKFKSDVMTWTAFWDSYKSAVHDNTEISAVDKFNYPKSLLEGPARCWLRRRTVGHRR